MGWRVLSIIDMEHVQRGRPLDLGLEGNDDLDRCEGELHVTTNTLCFYDMHMATISFMGQITLVILPLPSFFY